MVFFSFSFVAFFILIICILSIPNSLNHTVKYQDPLIDENKSNKSNFNNLKEIEKLCEGYNLLKKVDITIFKILSKK